ncbi:MAG TPA: hypothetical protein VGC26_09335 [Afipia sp.]
MKTILIWDPRFPARVPTQLTLEDDIASACYRAGIASAVNPSDQVALAAGPALSPLGAVEVVIQSGARNEMVQMTLPLEVAQFAIASGRAAAVGGVIGVLNVPTDALLGAEGLPVLGDTDFIRT